MSHVLDHFPVIRASSSRTPRLLPLPSMKDELRTTSVFLSVLSVVQPYATRLFKEASITYNSRTKMECFTEVKVDDANTWDGVIVLVNGKTKHKIMLEAKVGKNPLEASQLERYAALAKTHGIETIITVSNAVTATPAHPAIALAAKSQKQVKWVHWSWSYLLTQAHIQLEHMGVEDVEQHFLLEEFLRYVEDEKSGVMAFQAMGKHWKDTTQALSRKHPVSATSTEAKAVMQDVHGLSSYLALALNQTTPLNVLEKLSKTHTQAPQQRLTDDAKAMCQKHVFDTQFKVQGCKQDLSLHVDFGATMLKLSMPMPLDESLGSRWPTKLKRLAAALDEKGSYPDCHVVVNFKGKAHNTQSHPFADMFDERAPIHDLHKIGEVSEAALVMFVELNAATFQSPKKFVETTLSATQGYFEGIYLPTTTLTAKHP